MREKVNREQLEWFGETYVDAANWNDAGYGGKAIRADASRSARVICDVAKQDSRLGQGEEDKEIDFSMDEGGVITTRAGRRQVRELLDEPTLDATSPVGFHHQWGTTRIRTLKNLVGRN